MGNIDENVMFNIMARTTDCPETLLNLIKAGGKSLFALADHCEMIKYHDYCHLPGIHYQVIFNIVDSMETYEIMRYLYTAFDVDPGASTTMINALGKSYANAVRGYGTKYLITCKDIYNFLVGLAYLNALIMSGSVELAEDVIMVIPQKCEIAPINVIRLTPHDPGVLVNRFASNTVYINSVFSRSQVQRMEQTHVYLKMSNVLNMIVRLQLIESPVLLGQRTHRSFAWA
jgi:hypothetical protein